MTIFNETKGNDDINGRAGKDTLTRGSGADRFDFNSVRESLVGEGRDKIDISAIGTNVNLKSNQAFGAGAASSVWSVWEDDLWRPCFQNARKDKIKNFLCSAILIIPFFLFLAATIVAGIADLIVAAVKFVASWFNDEDDDRARSNIGSMSCDKIAVLSDDQLNRWTNAMLDGPTLDEDENAILKIVRCLPCDRLRDFYWPKFGARIRSDIDGSEFDVLQVELLRCGLVRISDWDDNATRRFIRSTPCNELGALSEDNLKALFQNMFEGHTGDDDERAIIQLTECIPVGTMINILKSPGFRRGDFDDEVDGSEWSQLKRAWDKMGIVFR